MEGNCFRLLKTSDVALTTGTVANKDTEVYRNSFKKSGTAIKMGTLELKLYISELLLQ